MSRNYEQHPEMFPYVRDCSNLGAAMRAMKQHESETGGTVKVDGAEVQYDGLPEQYRETVRLYIEHGVSPGTGWLLILSHDLAAVCYCDSATAGDLPTIYRWMYNHAPAASHGSRERAYAWMDAREAERTVVA